MTVAGITPSHLARPLPGEHDAYYSRYVELVPDGGVLERLAAQGDDVDRLMGGLDETAAVHRYAPGKWSIREVIGHITDAERIFTYRALRFARADATALSPFDENAYIANAKFDERSLSSLIDEFEAVRRASVLIRWSVIWRRASSSSNMPAWACEAPRAAIRRAIRTGCMLRTRRGRQRRGTGCPHDGSLPRHLHRDPDSSAFLRPG